MARAAAALSLLTRPTECPCLLTLTFSLRLHPKVGAQHTESRASASRAPCARKGLGQAAGHHPRPAPASTTGGQLQGPLWLLTEESTRGPAHLSKLPCPPPEGLSITEQPAGKLTRKGTLTVGSLPEDVKQETGYLEQLNTSHSPARGLGRKGLNRQACAPWEPRLPGLGTEIPPHHHHHKGTLL